MNDPNNWSNEQNTLAVINNFKDIAGGFVGGITLDSNGNIISANALRIIYEIDSSDVDRRNAYDKAFLQYWRENRDKYTYYDISMFTKLGNINELSRTVTADIPIVGLSFAIMIGYLVLTLGSLSCVKSRPTIAIIAVGLINLEIIAAMGLASYIGAKFHTLIMLIPYLLIGVGVDVCFDICIY